MEKLEQLIGSGSVIRKGLVLAGGSVATAAGVIMLFLPGPGTLIILAGISILSSEFSFARSLKERVMRRMKDAKDRFTDWWYNQK